MRTVRPFILLEQVILGSKEQIKVIEPAEQAQRLDPRTNTDPRIAGLHSAQGRTAQSQPVGKKLLHLVTFDPRLPQPLSKSLQMLITHKKTLLC
jgi:hypothetical protein